MGAVTRTRPGSITDEYYYLRDQRDPNRLEHDGEGIPELTQAEVCMRLYQLDGEVHS